MIQDHLEAQYGSEKDQNENKQLSSTDPVHAQVIVLNNKLVDEAEDLTWIFTGKVEDFW